MATAIPSAANEALRSSWKTCRTRSSRAARASASGVDRLPGATTAWDTPQRIHSSTRVAQNVAATPAVSLEGCIVPIVSPVRVDVWSDVVCPWCFIGKRRFDRAVEILQEKGVTETIQVVYRAYQLDPTAPIGEPTPVPDAYAKKFGGRERAEQILAHVTGIAASEGIEFRMHDALRANTTLAHRALRWALAVAPGSGPDAQARLKESLLSAYFTEGRDVGDPDTIAACADRAGLDGATLRGWLDGDGGTVEVVADLRAAIDREITGVPAFVIDDAFLVPGAQDTDTFVNVIERILARRADAAR
ncbi:MAG: DsbA family oxidoreductase [Actinobacteria bacterium]|nr:DsbA family oxidoreductase [Actinomycetota bacterium]